jgi:hypothetical protein
MRYTIVFIVLVLIGCEETVVQQDFPILTDCELVSNDPSGTVLKVNTLETGKYSTDSYGFVWDVNDPPTLEKSNKVEIGTNISQGTYEAKIEDPLNKGFTYYMRSYATYVTEGTQRVVYSNGINIKSTVDNRHWGLLMDSIQILEAGNSGIFSLYSGGYDAYGYVASCATGSVDAKLYTYNPKNNTFSDYKLLGYFDLFSYFERTEGSLYTAGHTYWEEDNSIIMKLTNTNYAPIDNPTIPLNESTQGIAYQNKLYFFNPSYLVSYSYDLTNQQQEVVPGLPAGLQPVGKMLIGDKAYVIAESGDIYVYDFVSTIWTNLTQYPGNRLKKFVYFGYNNLIHMGLSYDTSNEAFQDFWSYDTTLGQWKELEPFPKRLENGKMFFFFSDDKLFLGHGISMGVKYNNRHKFKLYSYDPKK